MEPQTRNIETLILFVMQQLAEILLQSPKTDVDHCLRSHSICTVSLALLAQDLQRDDHAASFAASNVVNFKNLPLNSRLQIQMCQSSSLVRVREQWS